MTGRNEMGVLPKGLPQGEPNMGRMPSVGEANRANDEAARKLKADLEIAHQRAAEDERKIHKDPNVRFQSGEDVKRYADGISLKELERLTKESLERPITPTAKNKTAKNKQGPAFGDIPALMKVRKEDAKKLAPLVEKKVAAQKAAAEKEAIEKEAIEKAKRPPMFRGAGGRI